MSTSRDHVIASKAMSSWLWSRYEYALPESPGYITQQLLTALAEAGLEIRSKGGSDDDTTRAD